MLTEVSCFRTHIFDGLTVTKETAAFQLCDIHDEMLKEMIEDEEDLRETCNVRKPTSSNYDQVLLLFNRSGTVGTRHMLLKGSRLCCATNSSRYWLVMLQHEKNARHY